MNILWNYKYSHFGNEFLSSFCLVSIWVCCFLMFLPLRYCVLIVIPNRKVVITKQNEIINYAGIVLYAEHLYQFPMVFSSLLSNCYKINHILIKGNHLGAIFSYLEERTAGAVGLFDALGFTNRHFIGWPSNWRLW